MDHERRKGLRRTLCMLEFAEAIRPLARNVEGTGLQEEIARQRETESWQSCDGVVIAVKNAQYMNATLSGAM